MRFVPAVYVFVSFTVFTVSLLAQSPNGNINGLVSDPLGAAVTDAEVVAVNDVTHVAYTTKTNGEGIYALPNLPPGPYGLQVSKIGFKTLIKRDVTLNVQDSLSINFTLLVGAFHEIVTVQGGAPLVNTESAAVSTVVDQTYVQNMPLNGRSFQDLILLTPGVVTQTSQSAQNSFAGLGQTGEFSVNGQRTESNYYTVDGVSANTGAASGFGMTLGAGASGSIPGATALGTTQALVSVDDLQEFRVQSSTYSAQYGRNPGGQFALETKSGTNLWHATAYEYLRNGVFDAADWFDNYFGETAPALRQNDFGGTFGGPMMIPRAYNGRDRTFFFVSYEGLRLTQPQAAAINYVPDASLRATAPAALQPALNAFPVQSPNGIDDQVNGIAEFIGSWSNPSSIDSTSVRFDHSLGERLRLFFRASNTSSSSAARQTYAAFGTPSINKVSNYTMRTYTGGASSFFSSRVSNDFRLNYSSNRVVDRNVIGAFGGSTPVDLVGLSDLSSGSEAQVVLLYGGYFVSLYQSQPSGTQEQWNLADTVNFTVGQHQMKFGVDYRRLTPSATPPLAFVPYYYASEGAVNTNSAFTFAEANAHTYPLYLNFSAFAQDQWKISRRLNFSLGSRWEVNPAPGVTKGIKPYTLKGNDPATWTLAPEGTALWQTTWYNFAPRAGVAFVLRDSPGREAVVRGGFGVFFDTGQQVGSNGFDNGPGTSAQTPFAVGAFPVDGAAVIPKIINPPTPPFASVVAFPTHLQLPFTLQWNLAIEQALGASQSVSISYVAAHGSRLLKEEQINTPSNADIPLVLFFTNGLTSDYDSLQAQFRRRFSRGLTALASYSWSHCIDYGSENYTLGYERGNCDFDVRHNLSTAFSYDFPNLRKNTVEKAVLNHWGLDSRFTVRSSFPVTFNGESLLQPNGQVYYAGLDLVEGQPVYLQGANCTATLQALGNLQAGQRCPGGRAINPCAFVNVGEVPGAPCPLNGVVGGLAPRNFARAFGALQMDLAVRREFPIHERLRLQFRAEAFNIFNHPNFGVINPNFGQKTFGQATQSLAASLGILSPLYQMGGPRSMQFALKFVF
jgi:hypothetical protein